MIESIFVLFFKNQSENPLELIALLSLPARLNGFFFVKKKDLLWKLSFSPSVNEKTQSCFKTG